MNIILLSGGSGKRLWPLSNDIRSKQFIPFFKNKEGAYESMVQRMYHSIKRIDSDANILIAAGEAQIPLLKEQLGEDIHISIEPARRDTFPAIALAVAYLRDIMHVDENESVIVCPVDPYVDDDYFETLKKLDSIVNENKSNLSLIGIEPTEPTFKYGYIIPKDNRPVSEVLRFTEKPDIETAKKYIEQGALWNAGIFGFKSGYILNRAKDLLGFKDYKSFFEHYDTATKISVDYAVVEHESSIRVMRFSGRWEDLGSWNAFTDFMEGSVFGKGIINDCKNVKIVNETNTPIIVNGLKDVIVSASKDGIYVTNVDKSDEIKKILEEKK